tara:strand:+ start:205 stop:789 length:585 start_codon:yes stop_codon:yes gene_type:complete
MNAPAEQIFDENLENAKSDVNNTEKDQAVGVDPRESSEFALKMINAVKSMNVGEITHHEMVNSFSVADELKCLYLFIKALPYNPIAKIYPEVPFLFFKGVPTPQAFDLSEDMASDIETFMKGQNSEYYADLRLHDLEQPYLDAYESGIRIYNDMVEKTRDSYHVSVKLAKSQVMEVSAVFVCLIVIFLTILGLS